MQRKFHYIFGPVYSWRLGVSVGIDLLSGEEKICNFNCEYCQLGETKNYQTERKIFVSSDTIIEEVKAFPEREFDYYTFSSSGEPTLASNLGEVIERLKEYVPDKKIAVITNASLVRREDVRKDLSLADFVLAKVDAIDEGMLKRVNSPVAGLGIDDILSGIKEFKKDYRGKLALQIMFVKNNANQAAQIAQMAKEINPQEVQLNTPLRPSSSKPLSERELEEIEKEFILREINCKTVYKTKKEKIMPLDVENTEKRHGKFSFSEEKK